MIGIAQSGLVILVGLAIDQIAQSGLSSLKVIYYSAQLFSGGVQSLQRTSSAQRAGISLTTGI
jgi:hypothetical protein